MITVLQDLCKVGDMNHFITQVEVCSRWEETNRKQRVGWRGYGWRSHIQSRLSRTVWGLVTGGHHEWLRGHTISERTNFWKPLAKVSLFDPPDILREGQVASERYSRVPWRSSQACSVN